MFKGLTNGRRNARAGGAGSSRVSGLHRVVGRSIEDEQRRRPAFLPATPQEQGFDGKNGRLGGLEN